jgi:hypothetical protein
MLVLGACLRAIMSNYHAVFLALGRVRMTPLLEGGRVVVMTPLTLVLAASHGLPGVAWAQGLSMGLGLVVSSAVLVVGLGLPAGQFVAQLVRPAAAGAIMAGVI